MARVIRQDLPTPPATYDQAYFAKLVGAINEFMLQMTAPAEVVAATYICTAPVIVDPSASPVPGSFPSTKGLPTGTFYLYPEPGGSRPGEPGFFYVSIVTEQDQQ